MPFYPKRGARSKKTMIDGILFDSLLESDTYLWLKEERDLGNISELKIQPKFTLLNKGVRKCENAMDGWSFNSSMTYTADFSYRSESGELVVVDSKGYIRATDPFKIRARIFLYLYPDITFLLVSRKKQGEPLRLHWYYKEQTK